MPYPDDEYLSFSNNHLINEELSYDKTIIGNELNTLINSLTTEQRYVYNQIMECVEGRTAHSRFHIPINLNEDSLCHIKPNNEVAFLLKETELIIWDEAPMIHKHAFEALDRTMKDIFMHDPSINSDIPFGGKVIVFGGDFRQILPVVPNSSMQEIVNASLSSSYIWAKCKVLRLTKNMRLTIGAQTSYMQKTNDFTKWLLDIGEGKAGGEATIDIPDDLLINDSSDPIQSLIDFVYPSILQQYKNPEFFRERAILALKIEVLHEINDRIVKS
ncbi:hypothetical protein L1987_42718 [Smallanthus sonchifolius]|uniref:Uncharacterized protein n=1 Tax=Smallanthus sonchifolius TaxID=185202 RepID=A0ACB9GJQ8_9ASTR|nr:hypothetical protein L1987_42718 [Smallanthus sonchifolius]